LNAMRGLPTPARTVQDGMDRGEPNRLVVLDCIRGIAALVVVVHHCLLTQPAFSDFFFSNWRTEPSSAVEQIMFHTPLRIVWDGYEAVTLFYVLSGLVLALPWIEGRPPSYFSYSIKRICRIYLPYCAAVGIAAILNTVLNPYSTVPGLSAWVNTMTWTHPAYPHVLLDHALMIGHYNSVNGVIHSLIWEMRVSLLFPLLIVPIARWRMWGAFGVAVALTALIGGIQIAYGGGAPALNLVQPGSVAGKVGRFALELQWTAYYGYFFVLGSVIANYLGVLRRLGRIAWVLLVAGLLTIQGHWSHLHAAQEVMVAIGSALIIMAALPQGPIHAALSHRWLRWVGRISYSLYLVHVPLLLTAVILLHGLVPMAAILFAVPFASLLVAWGFHEWVTEPCARLGKRLAKGRPLFSGARWPALDGAR